MLNVTEGRLPTADCRLPTAQMSYQFDYIITGAGCAGLSLAVHMIHSGQFSNKKILLVDRERKETNDRTWCFWEKEQGLFEPVVFNKWPKAWFHGKDFSELLDLAPYQYKMIRGIDFYNYCHELISRHPNFEFIYGDVKELSDSENAAEIKLNDKTSSALYLFNSILPDKPEIKIGQYYLLQHFKGWVIETSKPVFKKEEATLMDFRPEQEQGTRFMYIMPFSERRALVEYTIFSEKLLNQNQYEERLRNYLAEYLHLGKYKIIEEEFGTIPMTNANFPERKGRIIHIGTAGGQTKASTGYTFRFIQKSSDAITKSLLMHGHPFSVEPKGKKRFNWYDSILLNILSGRKMEGREIFTELFKKNKPSQILKFLDNETTLAEEFRLVNTLPRLPFIKAGLAELGW